MEHERQPFEKTARRDAATAARCGGRDDEVGEDRASSRRRPHPSVSLANEKTEHAFDRPSWPRAPIKPNGTRSPGSMRSLCARNEREDASTRNCLSKNGRPPPSHRRRLSFAFVIMGTFDRRRLFFERESPPAHMPEVLDATCREKVPKRVGQPLIVDLQSSPNFRL